MSTLWFRNGQLIKDNFTTSAVYGAELLPNGNLETWDSPTVLNGFTNEVFGVVTTLTPTFEQSTDSHGGTYAAKIVNQPDETATQVFYRNITGLSGDFIIQGWAGNSGLGNANICLYNDVRASATEIYNWSSRVWDSYSGLNTETVDHILPIAISSYTQFSTPIVPNPSNNNICAGFLGDFGNVNANTIWFDDLSIKQVTTTSTGKTLLILDEDQLIPSNDFNITPADETSDTRNGYDMFIHSGNAGGTHTGGIMKIGYGQGGSAHGYIDFINGFGASFSTLKQVSTTATFTANSTGADASINWLAKGAGKINTGSVFSVNKSFETPPAVVSTNTTLDDTHYVVLVSNGSTITLPTAVGCNGRKYNIIRSGTSNVLINTTLSQTISEDPDLTLTSKGDSVVVISDNSNWWRCS